MLVAKLALFLSERFDAENAIPPSAVIEAPLSVLTELILIVVVPPTVDCEILAAPDAVNTKSPDVTVLDPEATRVTVSVSVEATVTVLPA